MSNQGPPPQHEPMTSNDRVADVWYRWFKKFGPLLDNIDTLIESLQTGLDAAGNVSATSTFPTANNVLIVETAGTRNIIPSTVWTIDPTTGKMLGSKTGSSGSSDTTTFEIRSEFQAAFYPSGYGSVATAFLGGRRARGTIAAPTSVLANDALFNIGGRGNDGTSGILDGFSGTQALFSCRASENWSSTIKSTYWAMFTTTTGTTSQVERFRVDADGHTQPGSDNASNLGTAAKRWKEVFAANATINTSDARLKEITGTLDFAGRFVDAVEPILFRWLSGATDVIPDPSGAMEPNPAGDMDEHGNPVMQPRMIEVDVPGRRNHAGWLAQDIKAAMDAEGVDFSAWGLDDKNDPNSRQWTRPGELTAVLWEALRQTRAEVNELKSRIAQLEGTP